MGRRCLTGRNWSSLANNQGLDKVKTIFSIYSLSMATYHWNAEVRIRAGRRYCPPSASRCPDSWCWGWRPPASAGPAPTPAPTCRPGRQRLSVVTWRCPQHPRCCTWTLQVLRRSWSAVAAAPPARRAAPVTHHRSLSLVYPVAYCYLVVVPDSLTNTNVHTLPDIVLPWPIYSS